MSNGNAKLTHVAGTFLIQADGAFLIEREVPAWQGGGVSKVRCPAVC